jgi:3-hydroxyacyl-[acyl-carrier-protein] dehydratase
MSEIILNLDDIKSLIPHREPMLLLNEVRILGPSEARSVFRVSGDEFFLQGHYPENPIVPGHFQSEMLAQLGAVLIRYSSRMPGHPYHNLRKGKTPVLACLNNVRFKKPVKPGDSMELHFTITKDAGLIATAEAYITVGDTVSVSGEMTVAFI